MRYKQMKPIKYAEFCAGIGGFRMGFAMSKYNSICVYKNEIDDKCEKTYFDNYGELFDSKDIFSVDSYSLPKFDILCSGFPCQPFSIAGSRQGFSDNRGKIIFKLLEIISINRPPIVFLENVPNIARHERGDTLSKIIGELEGMAYSVFTKIIDSSEFGLPQSRPRLYIIAFRNNGFSNINFSFPTGNSTRKTIRDILKHGDNSIPISKKWHEYIDLYTNKKSVETLSFAPPKTRTKLERKSLDCNLDDCILQIRSSGIRAYSLDGQFPTFAVSNSGGGAMIPVLTKERRHINLVEMKRLMGFDDDFIFTINRTDSIKQLANAVCPPVIHELFNGIAEILINTSAKKELSPNSYAV
ncbi:MAG: DNA (cytosine-5-)-methyltransferase [Streptococcaceae bacterium]|nr:DNA (cytosine-5-)-methyltransferase [Streptococcaceae bacterium]